MIIFKKPIKHVLGVRNWTLRSPKSERRPDDYPNGQFVQRKFVDKDIKMCKEYLNLLVNLQLALWHIQTYNAQHYSSA